MLFHDLYMGDQLIGVIVLFIRIATVGALYSFLVWALWVLWQDLRAQADLNQNPQTVVEPIELFDRDNKQSFSTYKSQVTLGRDHTCDLNMDDSVVSAKHAQLSFHHGQWWLQDLESKNGTYLNQELIFEPIALADGDVIGISQMNYKVNLRRTRNGDRNQVYNDNDP